MNQETKNQITHASKVAERGQEYYSAKALEGIIVGGRLDIVWGELEQDGGTKSELLTAFTAAFEYLKSAANTSKTFELGKARMRLELLFLRAMSTQNYAAALGVQKEINKLNRLYAPTKSERKEVFEDLILKKQKAYEKKRVGNKK